MKADCTYCLDDEAHPCRRVDDREAYDFARTARAILESIGLLEDIDDRDQTTWALLDCADDIVVDHVDMLRDLLTCLVDGVVTPEQASVVAAGFVERALCEHGMVILDHLGPLAARSAKLRYILSGVWGERDMDGEVWTRLCRIVGTSDRMDDDPRTPSLGDPADSVVEEDEAGAMMLEPVVDERPGVPLFGEREEGHHYALRPGAYALIRDDRGRVAIVRTPTGVFLPGGGIDPGETATDALLRELREECGFVGEIGEFLGDADEFVDSPKYGRRFLKRCAFFAVDVVDRQDPVETDHELLWESPTRAAEMLKPAGQSFVVRRVCGVDTA